MKSKREATEQPPSMFEEDAQLGKVAAESLGDKTDVQPAPAVEVKSGTPLRFGETKDGVSDEKGFRIQNHGAGRRGRWRNRRRGR